MPSTSTGKKRGKRAELAEWLAHARPQQIADREFADLASALAPVSESYLRKLLRESGVPLAPTVEGVRQSNAEELARTLIALSAEYVAADAIRRASIRRLVIAAKDHARWAWRSTPEKRPEKQEMVLWMLTWLENPPLFPDWVQLRRSHTGL
ncbi:MAG TPA: hypothetical protein VMB85_19295 [Bryobacteraceae bacterium]|nr:hypothetical protein [Bryobacteraceae bacterium]